MAETPSKMIPLGTVAPDFTLLDTVSGEHKSLSNLAARKATVVMFICNHCPYVKLILPKMIEIASEYKSSDINFIAISSNDSDKYPADSPEQMSSLAKEANFPFPYLYDESQDVAKAYQAACTPDFYIFDHALKCVYRGRFDDATPGNGKPVTGKDLTKALNSILTGKQISDEQIPSVGCNIKWKK